jgi:hypothetical protein
MLLIMSHLLLGEYFGIMLASLLWKQCWLSIHFRVS